MTAKATDLPLVDGGCAAQLGRGVFRWVGTEVSFSPVIWSSEWAAQRAVVIPAVGAIQDHSG
jgi:hypothetical protein